MKNEQQPPKPQASPKTGGFFGRTFNFRAWADVDRNLNNAGGINQWLKKLFVPNYSTVHETLEDAMARLGLSEADIEKKRKALLRLSWLMVFLTLLILLYAGYHLAHAQYRAVALSVIIAFVSLGFAFRYNFWSFQIKQHKLGCTLREWFKHGLLGIKR